MKWILNGTLALIVAASIPSDVVGQGRTDIELNLYAGTSFFTVETFEIGPPQAPSSVPMSFELDRSLRGGLRLNFLTANRWGAETFLSYESSLATYRRLDDPSLDLALPAQIFHLGVNGLYYPLGTRSGRRIVPFLSGGIGAAIYRPTAEAKRVASDPLQGGLPELRESSHTAFNYGAGVKYRLTDWFGMRFDARGFFSKNPTFGLETASEDPTVPVLPLNNYIHNTEVSVGITLTLWKAQ